MSKKNCFKKIKRERYRELKKYYNRIDLLYDLFNKEPVITDRQIEKEVFDFIMSMTVYEVEKMFYSIFSTCEEYGIIRGLFEDNVSKFMIMLYIQQHKEDIITNGNLKD